MTYFGRGDGAVDRASGGDKTPFRREDICMGRILWPYPRYLGSLSCTWRGWKVGVYVLWAMVCPSTWSTAKTRLIDASLYFSYWSFTSTTLPSPCPSRWDICQLTPASISQYPVISISRSTKRKIGQIRARSLIPQIPPHHPTTSLTSHLYHPSRARWKIHGIKHHSQNPLV